MTFIK